MKINKYYKIILIAAFYFINANLFAQSGMMGNNPGQSVALDINASNKGVLIPQISLQNTTDINTIANPAVSLLVYNSNALISGNGAKGTGYYFYDGESWKKLIQSSEVVGDNLGNHITTKDLNMQDNKVYFNDNLGAKLEFLASPDASGIGLGNNYTTIFQSGEKNTSPGIFTWTNYAGTNNDVITERLRLTSAGNLGIGTSSPSTMLHVAGSTLVDQQLKVKNLLPAGSDDKVVTVSDSGLLKLSNTNVNSILQTCYYNMTQVVSNATQSVTLNSKVTFFMFTVTTTNSCGKQFAATYMAKNGVIFYMNKGNVTYTSTVVDPNGNSLNMELNLGTSCTSDTSQVNYLITLSGNMLSIQNTNTSTPQNYSIDMIQLG